MEDLPRQRNLTGGSRFVTTTVDTLVIPVIGSLPFLFVIDGTLGYSAYFFALSLIALVILRLQNKRDYTLAVMLHLFPRADYIMVSCAVTVLILNIVGNPFPSATAVFATIVVFFVPGWVLTTTILERKGEPPKKKGVLFILSFVISAFVSSLIFTIALLSQVLLTPVLLSLIYVVISVVPLVNRSTIGIHSGSVMIFQSKYSLYDVLLLIWLLAFFTFTISILYPEMSRVPGLDIVRHFSQTEGLLLAPEIYTSLYPWFHFLLASVMQLSAASMVAFQTVIAALSFMLIFSFYVMARAYLLNIDRRAPVLATVIFSVFTGFGWRYFLEKMPNLDDAGVQIQVWDLIFRATYFDIGYGEASWIWMWFRPVTLGTIILFVLLYLPRHHGFGRNTYILVCSMLLIALGQIHFSELVLFIFFTFILAVFAPKIGFRLKETNLSCIFALVAFVALSYFYPRIFESGYALYFEQHFSSQLLLSLGALCAIGFILAHYSKRPFSALKYRFKYTHAVAATLGVLFIYLILLFHWFLDSDSFALPSILTLLSVPSQFYPMLLGVTGLLAIISIPLLAKWYRDRHHPIIIFAVMFVLMILIGRAITYVGSESGPTGYFERRVIFHVFIASSILAPLSVLKIIDIVRVRDGISKARGLLNKPTTQIIISFMVVIGTLSMFLTVEYQRNYISENALPISEIDALQKHVQSDPYSTLLTASFQSKNRAEFSSPGYLVGAWSKQIWPSETPELPLNIMALYNSSFVYTQGKDEQLIDSTYSNSFINRHLLDVARVAHKEESQTLFQLPMLSPPVPSSVMVLVLPDYNYTNADSYYAYDMLSLNGYNYTTAPLSDISSISNAKILVAPNEAVASKIIQYKEDYSLDFQKLVVLNSDGNYGMIWQDLAYLDKSNLFEAYENIGSWIPNSSGYGDIGMPHILEDSIDNSLSGLGASKILVGEGNNSIWQISKEIPEKLQNLTDFDFVYFDWYGRGDGKWYVLQFTSASNGFFWYKFQDSESGWKRIILPLHVPDGRSNVFGTVFDKYAKGGPSWSEIARVKFGTEAQNENQGGNFYLDGFYFGKELVSPGLKTVNVSQNDLDRSKVQFSENVKLLPYHSKSTAAERVLFENTDIPFILEKRISSDTTIVYVNMHPIVQQIDLVSNGKDVLSMALPKSDSTEYEFMKRTPFQLISNNVGAFSAAQFRGDLKVNSTSAVIDHIEGQVTVDVEGRSPLLLEDVNRIIPISIENVEVESHTGGSLEKGRGFYSLLMTNQSLIKLTGDPGAILVEFDSKGFPVERKAVLSGNTISLNISKSGISLRQPAIYLDGIAEFEEFYGYGSLNSKIPNLGQQLKVEGQTSFVIDYSDEFSVINSALFDGKLQSEQPVYPYDELGSLSNILSLPYARHIVVVTILLSIVAVYLLDKKSVIHLGQGPKE